MSRTELLRTLALANEFREGDLLVGGSADEQVRAEARRALAAVALRDLDRAALVEDEVGDALSRSLERESAAELSSWTVADVHRTLLAPRAESWVRRHRDGLSSEAIAAVVKLMTNAELAALSRGLHNPIGGGPGEVAIGAAEHFGSRIQPNSVGDDEEEVLLSTLEGLGYGCGDVILGLNPASDDVDAIVRMEELLGSIVERLELPTRFCVLSDIVKQTAARARTRVDVGFQSLAGTSRALRGMVGLDVEGLADLARGFDALYFETGQGSEVTNGAEEGVDAVTLEARTYGLARAIGRRVGPKWTIVNDVSGFIGPEVFRTAEQLERVCLEDLVMGKLHGLTMGLDVGATFHMAVDPAALRRVTETVVADAAPAYLMAIAGNADALLGYQTTSFREHPRLRRRTGRALASPMRRRLAALGVLDAGGNPARTCETTADLYAAYVKASGDRRTADALRAEGRRKLEALRGKGLDVGLGDGEGGGDPPEATARMARIYAHARRALFATIDAAVLRDASPRHLRVATRAESRDDYLAHPRSGERLRDEDVERVRRLHSSRRPDVQLVISDGLDADAANENLRAILPALRRGLRAIGRDVGATDVVVANGRVRAGYHVGEILDVDVVVHLIGERPGTGLDALSAYVTYGRDAEGRSRWSRDLDHAATTAICGIHERGKPPLAAADEIARVVARMFAERRSGVALGREPAAV